MRFGNCILICGVGNDCGVGNTIETMVKVIYFLYEIFIDINGF